METRRVARTQSKARIICSSYFWGFTKSGLMAEGASTWALTTYCTKLATPSIARRLLRPHLSNFLPAFSIFKNSFSRTLQPFNTSPLPLFSLSRCSFYFYSQRLLTIPVFSSSSHPSQIFPALSRALNRQISAGKEIGGCEYRRASVSIDPPSTLLRERESSWERNAAHCISPSLIPQQFHCTKLRVCVCGSVNSIKRWRRWEARHEAGDVTEARCQGTGCGNERLATAAKNKISECETESLANT